MMPGNCEKGSSNVLLQRIEEQTGNDTGTIVQLAAARFLAVGNDKLNGIRARRPGALSPIFSREKWGRRRLCPGRSPRGRGVCAANFRLQSPDAGPHNDTDTAKSRSDAPALC